jgi:hypothetical protein
MPNIPEPRWAVDPVLCGEYSIKKFAYFIRVATRRARKKLNGFAWVFRR